MFIRSVPSQMRGGVVVVVLAGTVADETSPEIFEAPGLVVEGGPVVEAASGGEVGNVGVGANTVVMKSYCTMS